MSDYQLIQCSDDDLQELKRLALAVRAASDDDEALGLALDEYDEHANPDQVLCLFDEIDRITAERDALQQLLNVVDQRNDDLANKVQCQFPQSCTTRCDCKTAAEALKPENQRIVPIDRPLRLDYFNCLKGD